MPDRILEARYTSPSGKEAVFAYETVSRETELKTGVFTFPSRDGAHVQHQGMGARSFPLACIFSGDNSMEKADAFEAMLIEQGVGELQHPYGTIKVVPTGNITRSDDLVSGVNESVVTITFTETITDEEAASLDAVAADEIEAQLNEFTDAACADFAGGIDTGDISEQLAAQSALEAQTRTISDNLTPLAGANKKTFADWLASLNELKSGIKNLYSQAKNAAGKVEGVYVKALNIARLTLRIMNLPAREAITLSSKIQGYSKITADLINQYKNDPFGAKKIANAYAAARLALCGAAASIAAGSALSVARSAQGASGAAASGAFAGNNDTGGGSGSGAAKGSADASAGTASREEAVETATRLITMLETITKFSDTKVAQNVFVDSDSEAYLALASLVQTSVRLILQVSFALPMQRTITLERDRQIIELCAELYGSCENGIIDQFIRQNDLSIDEIGLIPMGRRVSYYVQSA